MTFEKKTNLVDKNEASIVVFDFEEKKESMERNREAKVPKAQKLNPSPEVPFCGGADYMITKSGRAQLPLNE